MTTKENIKSYNPLNPWHARVFMRRLEFFWTEFALWCLKVELSHDIVSLSLDKNYICRYFTYFFMTYVSRDVKLMNVSGNQFVTWDISVRGDETQRYVSFANVVFLMKTDVVELTAVLGRHWIPNDLEWAMLVKRNSSLVLLLPNRMTIKNNVTCLFCGILIIL